MPRFFVAQEIVIGSVALDDEVEKATICASNAPRKKGTSGRRKMPFTMKP